MRAAADARRREIRQRGEGRAIMPHARLTVSATASRASGSSRCARHGDRHDLRDLTVAIRFEGEYDASYTDGDNTDVLPTDTMKNTVYALAAREPVAEPEPFGLGSAVHFLERNPRLNRVRIDLTEHPWGRIAVGGREHGQAFVRAGPKRERPSMQARAERHDRLVPAFAICSS